MNRRTQPFDPGVHRRVEQTIPVETGEGVVVAVDPDGTVHRASRSAGVRLIGAERTRQVTEEGYDAEHDRDHAEQLAHAAISYGAFAAVTVQQGYSREDALSRGGSIVPSMWPWSSHYWKPTGDPVRDLVKAGALIAAAIDALEAARAPRSCALCGTACTNACVQAAEAGR